MSKRDIQVPKCGGCEHVLKEHYHLKSEGHGCIGDSGKCMCITFLIK